MPLAEAQSEWIADVLEGKVGAARRRREMRREIARDRAAMAKRYVASKRHTIQVDFDPYLRSIRRERRGGPLRRRLLGGRRAREPERA